MMSYIFERLKALENRVSQMELQVRAALVRITALEQSQGQLWNRVK